VHGWPQEERDGVEHLGYGGLPLDCPVNPANVEDALKRVETYFKKLVAKGIRSLSIRWKSHEVALPCLADGERWLRRTRYLDITPADGLSGLFIYDQRIAVISSSREKWK